MLHSTILQYIGAGTVFTVYSLQHTPEYTVGGHSVQTQHNPVSTQHTSVSAQSSHYTLIVHLGQGKVNTIQLYSLPTISHYTAPTQHTLRHSINTLCTKHPCYTSPPVTLTLHTAPSVHRIPFHSVYNSYSTSSTSSPSHLRCVLKGS